MEHAPRWESAAAGPTTSGQMPPTDFAVAIWRQMKAPSARLKSQPHSHPNPAIREKSRGRLGRLGDQPCSAPGIRPVATIWI
jgi:hypothetical protein